MISGSNYSSYAGGGGYVSGSSLPLVNLGFTAFIDFIKNLLGFQMGGAVQSDGLYNLHAGEYVVSKDGGETAMMGGSTSIVVNASINSDYDVRRLADRLGEELYKQKRSYGGLNGR
jgi:hypothetical protein